jgi:hypothetical protein
LAALKTFFLRLFRAGAEVERGIGLPPHVP